MKNKEKFYENISHYDREIEWLFNPKKGGFDYEVVKVASEVVMVDIAIFGTDFREKLIPKKDLGYIFWQDAIKFDMYFFDFLIYEESKEDLKAEFIQQLDGKRFFYLVDADSDKGLGLYIK